MAHLDTLRAMLKSTLFDLEMADEAKATELMSYALATAASIAIFEGNDNAAAALYDENKRVTKDSAYIKQTALALQLTYL